MKISFTGTRAGMTDWQKVQLARWLRSNSPASAAHGLCSGSDEEFHLMVRSTRPECYIVGFPSTAKTRSILDLTCDFLNQPRPPLVRNPSIVDAGKDLLIATPRRMYEEQRSGTWSSIRYARKKKIPTLILWPEGKNANDSEAETSK